MKPCPGCGTEIEDDQDLCEDCRMDEELEDLWLLGLL